MDISARDLERIPVVLAAVWRVWERHPKWRLSTVIWRMGMDKNLYIEDDELLRRIEEELAESR